MSRMAKSCISYTEHLSHSLDTCSLCIMVFLFSSAVKQNITKVKNDIYIICTTHKKKPRHAQTANEHDWKRKFKQHVRNSIFWGLRNKTAIFNMMNTKNNCIYCRIIAQRSQMKMHPKFHKLNLCALFLFSCTMQCLYIQSEKRNSL